MAAKYLRMQAPAMVTDLPVVAFVADGMSSGYALLDQQEAGTVSRFCVTHVGLVEDSPVVQRWGGIYFDGFDVAMRTFANMATRIADDEALTLQRFPHLQESK
jgi:hypothetical protein